MTAILAAGALLAGFLIHKRQIRRLTRKIRHLEEKAAHLQAGVEVLEDLLFSNTAEPGREAKENAA